MVCDVAVLHRGHSSGQKCLEMGENDKKGQETGETTKVSRNGRNIISPVDKIHSMPAGQRTARA